MCLQNSSSSAVGAYLRSMIVFERNFFERWYDYFTISVANFEGSNFNTNIFVGSSWLIDNACLLFLCVVVVVVRISLCFFVQKNCRIHFGNFWRASSAGFVSDFI